jgi:hypothetical protein
MQSLRVSNPTNTTDYQQVRKPWDRSGTKSGMTVNVAEELGRPSHEAEN